MASASTIITCIIATAADLPADILNCIQKHLPLADYIRFPAVCTSWRYAAKLISNQPFSDTEFPWLFSLTSEHFGKEFASAISLSPDNSLAPEIYSIPIPKHFQGHTITTADYHCLMIENINFHLQDHNNSGIYLVNPFDSWTQLGRLPSSATLSDNPTNHPGYDKIFRIAMNSSVAVATWGLCRCFLAYTRLGLDHRWINLEDITRDSFEDVVTYKNDMFCAVDIYGAKVIALDFSSPTVRLIDMTLNLQTYKEDDGWKCLQEARFVKSSTNLFLIRWRNLIKIGEKKRREVDIHVLMDVDDAGKKWVPVKSLDNFSFFIGVNQSISLSTATFPRLRSNCIYFPRDAVGNLNRENYSADLDDDDDFRTQLIYNLGNESWDQYDSDYFFDGLWMTPCLLSKRPPTLS